MESRIYVDSLLTSAQVFAPYVTELRGIDVSAKEVREYNTRAVNQGLLPSEMFAYAGNLLDTSGPSGTICGPDLFHFDLAVVGLGLHHFDDPQLAIKRLLERLKDDTGVLLIIDFVPHEHDESKGKHHVAHDGFGKEKMRALIEGAGCQEVDYVVLGKGATWTADGQKHERSIFMCRGRKASMSH